MYARYGSLCAADGGRWKVAFLCYLRALGSEGVTDGGSSHVFFNQRPSQTVVSIAAGADISF
jgi:hypothetical protein